MRPRKGREALARGVDKLRDAARVAAAQSQNADCEREQILDAMVHFPKQELLPFLRALGLRDVTGDFRGAYDFASLIFDRRNGEGNIDEAPVLALSNRLVMIDTLAPADTFEDHRLFVMSVRRNEHGYRPSDGLLRGVAKEELGATVPSHNHAIEVFGKDRIG